MLAHAAISLVETSLRAGKLWFCCRIAAPKLAYGIWGVVQPKGKATAHPKMGVLSEPFGNCGLPNIGDVAAKLPRAQTALREGPSLLGVAIAIISQATVLAYQ